MTSFDRINSSSIDTQKEINFIFNGQKYTGFQGDTLASALIANGIKLIARSFKYHRPRGIISCGSQEPNGLVELIHKDFREPNTKATTIELYEGLEAKSQNSWPSLKYDFMSLNDRFSKFIGAGFYYKTFMWPASFWEKIYEPLIRKAAGLGKLSYNKNERISEKGFLHCDLLVIGSGPSGLVSAYLAGLSGAKVILVEEDFIFGGNLNNQASDVSKTAAQKYLRSLLKDIMKMPNVRCMRRTCVIGMFDHGIFGALEKLNQSKIDQIFWKIKSKKALLCTGALERLIPFQNNDRPGIMLSGSIRSYLNRWGINNYKDVLLFTNNNDAYLTASNLISSGVNVVGVVDTRDKPKIFDSRIKVFQGSQVINTRGKLELKGVDIQNKEGKISFVKCNVLGVSGGWNPNIQISCHTGVKPEWNKKISAFIPGKNNISTHLKAVGSANGKFTLSECISSAEKAVLEILNDLNFKLEKYEIPSISPENIDIDPF